MNPDQPSHLNVKEQRKKKFRKINTKEWMLYNYEYMLL